MILMVGKKILPYISVLVFPSFINMRATNFEMLKKTLTCKNLSYVFIILLTHMCYVLSYLIKIQAGLQYNYISYSEMTFTLLSQNFVSAAFSSSWYYWRIFNILKLEYTRLPLYSVPTVHLFHIVA